MNVGMMLVEETGNGWGLAGQGGGGEILDGTAGGRMEERMNGEN